MAGPATSGSVPILAPDGKVYMVPPEQAAEAHLHGGKTALRIAAPGGTQHWVPVDQAEDALAHGGTVVRQDGRPYAQGQAPVIVGRNSGGQPIWGNAPDAAKKEGFLGSVGSALSGAAKGAVQMLDPRPNEDERSRGLTSPYDYALRPFERVAEGQVGEAERAVKEGRSGNTSEALGHGLAAALPMMGPWAASTAEKVGTQVGEGDTAGAAGTLVGNGLVAAAPEVVPKGVRAGIETTRGRLQEIINPRKALDTPVAPGDLSPAERWRAANRMNVNLDRAQATNAAGPKMAKTVTEQSLLGKRAFEANNAANVDALHSHAANMLDETAPHMTREDFGNHAKAKLSAHRAELADEPGQRAQAEALLNSADPRAMNREEFGDAAKEALEHHRLGTEEKINDLYHDLDGRLGDLHPDMKGVKEKAQAIYSQNKRFYENHPDLLKGADARAWAIIKDFSGVDDKAAGASIDGATKAPVDTWADLQRARSHLLDLTRGPDFLGELSTGWIKQMTGAIDGAMTSAENTPGLKAKDVQQFRQANSLYKGLKETYDNPQSPFYWASRQEGLKVADRLNGLGPEDARRFREVMHGSDHANLVGQQRRQFMQRLLDPAGNGEVDLAGLKNRWTKLPKEQTESILEPAHMKGLNDLAEKSATETPYDAAGSRLAQVIKAPDGMAASRAMFTDSGALRLTPEEVRQMGEADPTLLPQLRRQAMHRIFDPSDNGATDLRNFSARWNRAQKEPLGGVLSPEQMKDLDDMASVAKTVNLPANPSGTAVVMQPVQETGGLLRATGRALPEIIGAGAGTAVGGIPGAMAGALAGEVANTVARGAVAKRLVNPEATAKAMEHTPPVPVADAAKKAIGDVDLSRGAATAGTVETANPDSAEQRWKEVNGGQPPQPSPGTPGTVHPALNIEPVKPGAGAAVPDSPVQPALKAPVPPGQSPATEDAAKLSVTNAQISRDLMRPPVPAPTLAPDGATHEVVHPDGKTVLGHMVDGAYVPLNASPDNP